MIKRITSLALAFTLMFSTSLSLGHPGRTDSSGGHKDNKNKSGLGSYHYHCGEYPAHLHNNGVCPYSSTSQDQAAKSTTNNNSVSSSKQSTVDNSLKAQVPNFSVFINGTDINTSTAEYPPLICNNIIYIPFTLDIITYLDLEYIWDQPSNLIINRSSESVSSDSFVSKFQDGTSNKGMNCTIVKVDKKIMINETEINSQYPIINYKNVNYLPLTYEIISNLGLSNEWDPTIGFKLTVK